MHKESHQILDLVNLFEPITKYSTEVRAAETIPEVVRKAFKVARSEKPGAAFISLPENIAGATMDDAEPLKVQAAQAPAPPAAKVAQAAQLLSDARFPLVFAGNDNPVTGVMVGGVWVVRHGRHPREDEILAAYKIAVAELAV